MLGTILTAKVSRPLIMLMEIKAIKVIVKIYKKIKNLNISTYHILCECQAYVLAAYGLYVS